jgi:hypothetical protein
VANTDVHNNVVYMTPSGSTQSAAFIAHDWGSNGKVPKNVLVRNNIFQTTGGVKVVALTGNVAKNGTFKFNANAYYSSGKAFKIQWGDRSYTSLSAWRSGKGQEKYSGVATGFQGDPRLKAPGHGGTIGNPDKLRSKLGAYQLARSSPVINKGVPRLAFLSARVKQPFDFFGGKGLRNGKFDIGVNEVK